MENKRVCYNCGEEGHFAHACTKYHQKKNVMSSEPEIPKAQLSIGDAWYVVGQEFKGELYIHVREYMETKKRLIPTKNGVGLKTHHWKDLELYRHQIEAEVARVKNGEAVSRTWHLGDNWIVTVNHKYPGVDIRKFWLPPNAEQICATKKGIFVPFERFDRLTQAIEVLPMFLPTLTDFLPCYMQDDHQNQQGVLDCKQCTPNGFTDDIAVQ